MDFPHGLGILLGRGEAVLNELEFEIDNRREFRKVRFLVFQISAFLQSDFSFFLQ